MDKILKQHVFNPKSMHKTKLLGQIDLDTRQWNDGVLTLYSLQVTAEPAGNFLIINFILWLQYQDKPFYYQSENLKFKFSIQNGANFTQSDSGAICESVR